jgi:DNA helicase-2/ATP-dependent DNA helicase PcrA
VNEQHEANLIVEWFKRLHDASGQGAATRAGVPWREMAVFYRTNSLSRVMEEAFRTAGVPYTIARGTSFYEREEIKNALSYLRVVANSSDDVSLERIVNTPARGIGDASLGKIADWGSPLGLPLFESLRRVARNEAGVEGLTARAQNAVQKFVQLVEEWTGGGTFMGARVPTSLAELVERVVKESGLESMYSTQAKTSGNEADAERLDNLSELVSSARQFELEYDPDSDPAEFPGETAIREGRSASPPAALDASRVPRIGCSGR